MINISDKTKCCGCSACASACPKKCISIQSDNEGFLYPVVNANMCIECKICEKACPIINVKSDKSFEQKAYIVQHKNEQILRESTSGGAFTAIAEYVIDEGGVVFGAAFDENFKIIHTYAETKEELGKFRNSKYVQSDIGDSFIKVKKFLTYGRMVCFSGTPCQVDGLRCFLKKDYDNLILVDVVCRAVPSPGVWKSYLEMVQNEIGAIEKIYFRDKKLGYQYSTMVIQGYNGKEIRGGIESSQWLRMFFSSMIIRPSCTKCQFRSIYRHSDFTIWDSFDVADITRKLDEIKGATKVVIQSQKGMRVFEHIKKDFQCVSVSVERIVGKMLELSVSPQENILKKDFFVDYEKMPFSSLIEKYFPITWKVRAKRYGRICLNHLGLDRKVKQFIRKLRQGK